MLTFRKSPKLRELHNLLIEKRNSVIAHAYWEARNVAITVTGPVSMHVAFSKPDIGQGVDIPAFRQLADGVRQDCIFATLRHAQRGMAPTGSV